MRIFLIITVISVNSFADSTKEIWTTACKGSYLIAISNLLNPDKDTYSKFRDFIEHECDYDANDFDKKGYFKTMKDPMYKGCIGAMVFIPNSKDEKKKMEFINLLQNKFCSDVQGR